MVFPRLSRFVLTLLYMLLALVGASQDAPAKWKIESPYPNNPLKQKSTLLEPIPSERPSDIRPMPKGRFVDIPTAMLLFPDDIAVPAPDRWIRRSYNLIQRHDAPSGGHFAAFEKGPLFVEDVREFFRPFR